MTMTKKQAEEIIATGELKQIKSKSDLSEIWFKAMSLKHMSDLGGGFSAACTGTESHSRMIAAAISEKYGLLIAEHGGIVHICNLSLYCREKNEVIRVYSEAVNALRIAEIVNKLGK
jgi:hypothetical protein